MGYLELLILSNTPYKSLLLPFKWYFGDLPILKNHYVKYLSGTSYPGIQGILPSLSPSAYMNSLAQLEKPCSLLSKITLAIPFSSPWVLCPAILQYPLLEYYNILQHLAIWIPLKSYVPYFLDYKMNFFPPNLGGKWGCVL